MNKPIIGFIGLGMMGHGMARNLLLKGGLRFAVHRRRDNPHDLLAAGAGRHTRASCRPRISDSAIDLSHRCSKRRRR